MKLFTVTGCVVSSYLFAVVVGLALGSMDLSACIFDGLDPAEKNAFEKALRDRPDLEADRLDAEPWEALNYVKTQVPQNVLDALRAVTLEQTGFDHARLSVKEQNTAELEYAKKHWLKQVPFHWKPGVAALEAHRRVMRANREISKEQALPVSHWLSLIMSRPQVKHDYLASRDAFERHGFHGAIFLLFYANVVKAKHRNGSHHNFVKDLMQLVALRTELSAQDLAELEAWFGHTEYYGGLQQAISQRNRTAQQKPREYIAQKIEASKGPLSLDQAREILHAFEINFLYGGRDSYRPRFFVAPPALRSGELTAVIKALSSADSGPFMLEIMRATFFKESHLRWNWYEWREVHRVAEAQIETSYPYRNALLAKLRDHFEGDRRILLSGIENLKIR